MTEQQYKNIPIQTQIEDESDIHLIDLIYTIHKHRKFLIIFCLLVVVAVGVLSVLSPKTYEATAVVLPEEKENAGGAGELKAAFLEQFGLAGLGEATATPAEVFEAILKSRELAREVLRRYRFYYVEGVSEEKEEEFLDKFIEKVKVKKARNGPTISVTTMASNPFLAADLANTYVTELDRYNRNNTITAAQRLRQYIERRMKEAEKELEQAQDDLRKFQEKNKAISISKQAEATLAVLSELEAKRLALEVEKAAKQKFYKGPHMEIELLAAQMAAIRKNIDQLTYSEESKVPIEKEKGKVEFYIPLVRIPALNFEESQHLLKVKTKTGVVTMLNTQLEQAILDEARDMPTISVLDWANSLNKQIKPRFAFNIALSFIVAFFIGVFLIFATEFARRVKQDFQNTEKIDQIRESCNDSPVIITIKKGHIRVSQGEKTLAISESLKQDN
jgi:uncharacterized protein involved in exopolysaccharide biosynthesis